MTLKQFRETTKDFPENMDIYFYNNEPDAEYRYHPIDSLEIENVKFYDEDDRAIEPAYEKVVVIKML